MALSTLEGNSANMENLGNVWQISAYEAGICTAALHCMFIKR